MQIAVIALGKVGLPVAALLAARGHTVVGCDIDPDLVALVNRGGSHLPHEPGLAERVAVVVSSGNLRATTDTAEAVSAVDVVIVLVPLDVDDQKQPDFRSMDAAFEQIAASVADGALVLLETTVPVGTSRDRYRPLLADAAARRGIAVSLAFSPERLQSGRVERDLTTYPRIVGGTDAASAERAAAFYADAYGVPVITLATAEAAEFCKLAESIYRDVNIALANELARYAVSHGVDMHEVITAANSQPQSHLHRPGLGVGGHCIPVYPYFMTTDAERAPLTLAAREINDAVHRHAADLLDDALGGVAGQRVLILGLTYRPGVKETAHSPALDLAAELRRRGAFTLGSDPLLSDDEIAWLGVAPYAYVAGQAVDAVAVHTADPAFAAYDLCAIPGLRVVLDCAGSVDAAPLLQRGIEYRALGRPGRQTELGVAG